MKTKKYLYLLLSLPCILLAFAPMVKSKGVNATAVNKSTVQNTSTSEVQETLSPIETLPPENTEIPTQTPQPAQTQQLEPSPLLAPLKKVSGLKLIRYSGNTIKLVWDKHEKAKYYRIYFSRKKESGYHQAGITKKNYFMARKLKNNKNYYFYIQACQKRKKSATDSKPSRKKIIKMRPYSRKTIFAGDSIAKEAVYAFPSMHIGGHKQIVAKRGLKTGTFYTQRVFNGKSGLEKLISEKPYRVYFMLGMNGVHYTPLNNMIADYRYMIQKIKKESPKTDIVLCAISPVSRAKYAYQPGFKKTPLFNKKLKKLAKQTDTHYFDYTGFLKDSKGFLKTKYAAEDGYHWKRAAYAKFAKKVEKFEKSLDK